MSTSFYETSKHSELYVQCRPTYPTDIINIIVDYLTTRV